MILVLDLFFGSHTLLESIAKMENFLFLGFILRHHKLHLNERFSNYQSYLMKR